MAAAAGWGLLGASSLLIGAVLGLTLRIPSRLVGLILGFGAGTLISAVAFELTDEAFQLGGADAVAVGLAIGALTYFAGDAAIESRGGERRMSPSRRREGQTSQADAASALLLGAVLDGIPEAAASAPRSSPRSSSPTCPNRLRRPEECARRGSARATS